MRRYSRAIPDGARDLLFGECRARRSVEKTLVEIFRSRGFSELATPSLEFYDVFSGNSAAMDDEMMYKLVDAHGRILVLRPDNTTPIARIASTKLKGFVPPLRLCYNQHVFRVSRYMSGRYDEVAQCGIELIGASGKKADCDVILTAVEALSGALGGSFRFEIGHVGFYRSIIDSLPFEDADKEQIRSLIASKSYASLDTLLKPYVKENSACLALMELPRLFGGREVLSRAAQIVPNDAARETLDYLSGIYDTLCKMGLEGNVMMDLGLVQQIDYYTGVVFRGYTHGYGEPVLSGGRYDGLFTNFGVDTPAAGFAVDADAIARSSEAGSNSVRPDVIVYYEEDIGAAYAHAAELAKEGYICEMSVSDTLEQTKEYARARGVHRIDLTDGGVKIIEL